MKEIPLTRREVAIVDDEDYDWLSLQEWVCLKSNNSKYAIMKGTFISMHRAILGFPDGEIDHINMNGLCNWRLNLRVVPHFVNLHNQRVRSDNTTGATGVVWSPNMWKYQLTYRKKLYHEYGFQTIEDAAAARNAKLVSLLIRDGFPPIIGNRSVPLWDSTPL